MKDGDFVCEACKTKLNASDLNCWRCGSRNLTDMRPSMIGAGPFNVPIRGVDAKDDGRCLPKLGGGLGEPPFVPLDSDKMESRAETRDLLREVASWPAVDDHALRSLIDARAEEIANSWGLLPAFYRGRQWK